MRRGQVERLPYRLLLRAGVPPPEPFELEHRAFAIGEWRPLDPDPSAERSRQTRSDIAARHGGRFERGCFQRRRFKRGRFEGGRFERGRLMRRFDELVVDVLGAWPSREVSSTSPSRGRGGRGRRPADEPTKQPTRRRDSRHSRPAATAISGATSISVATSDRATRAMSTRVPSSPDVQAEAKVHMGRRRAVAIRHGANKWPTTGRRTRIASDRQPGCAEQTRKERTCRGSETSRSTVPTRTSSRSSGVPSCVSRSTPTARPATTRSASGWRPRRRCSSSAYPEPKAGQESGAHLLGAERDARR